MIFRLLLVVCVFALRFFVQPAPLVPAAADAPPPPMEDCLTVADAAGDDSSDDPSDLDDDDDDSDDAALPAAIRSALPPVTVARPAWSIHALTDQNGCHRLFRPPRLA